MDEEGRTIIIQQSAKFKSQSPQAMTKVDGEREVIFVNIIGKTNVKVDKTTKVQIADYVSINIYRSSSVLCHHLLGPFFPSLNRLGIFL